MDSNSLYCDRRAMVILDVPWLFHSTKNLEGGKIDYARLMANLVEEQNINCVRAVAFVLDTREEGKEDSSFESFLHKLRSVPLEVVLVKPRPNRSDCNVPIATEAMYMRDKIDLLVLATGNGDFCYLVDRLNNDGINTVLLTYNKICSKDLKEKAIDVIEISRDVIMGELIAAS